MEHLHICASPRTAFITIVKTFIAGIKWIPHVTLGIACINSKFCFHTHKWLEKVDNLLRSTFDRGDSPIREYDDLKILDNDDVVLLVQTPLDANRFALATAPIDVPHGYRTVVYSSGDNVPELQNGKKEG